MILLSNKLAFFSTLPVIFSELVNVNYVKLTIYFEEDINLIIVCFLYGLIGLTLNRIYEVYYE